MARLFWAPSANSTALYPSLSRSESIVTSRPNLEFRTISTPARLMASISAFIVSRGRRYSGMPTAIIPPATGSAS